MVSEVADAMVERLMERVKANSAEVAAMLGDPDIGSAFHGGIRDISNNKDRHPIYNTETGERVDIPLMYLRKTLQKKRVITAPSGEQRVVDAFVPGREDTGEPLTAVPEFKAGELKCFLHPQHPDRAWLESIGVGPEIVCGDNQTRPAGSFRTTFNRDYHEKKKHPITWQIREEAKARQREQEQIDRQERQIEAMMALTGQKESGVLFACEQCDHDPFPTKQGLLIHKGRDHKE